MYGATTLEQFAAQLLFPWCKFLTEIYRRPCFKVTVQTSDVLWRNKLSKHRVMLHWPPAALEFSLNVFTKIILFSKRSCSRTHYFLCERQRLYHCSTETQLTENTVKLILIHASVIFSNSLNLLNSPNSLNSMKVPFHLEKTPLLPSLTQLNCWSIAMHCGG